MGVTIKTDNLTLRNHTEYDFERYWGMLNEQVMWNPESKKDKLNYTDCFELYKKRISAPFSDEGADFAIIDEKDKYVGRCGFRKTEKGAEFYYLFCMDAWGHGYTHEAAEAVLKYLFANFSHEQYYIPISEGDGAKIKICTRLGFEESENENGIFVINRE